VENLVEMNSTMSFTDPGAALGRAFLKIGQVLVGILTAGCVYLAYLASEGFFSDWKVDLDEDLTWPFPHLSVRSMDRVPLHWTCLEIYFLVWIISMDRTENLN
jgi:hypothetical protein